MGSNSVSRVLGIFVRFKGYTEFILGNLNQLTFLKYEYLNKTILGFPRKIPPCSRFSN